MKLAFLAALLFLAFACAPDEGAPARAVPYLEDASYRRAELTASLVNPRDGYAAKRLAHYATGDAEDWDRAPEWNPPVEAIAASELDRRGGAATRTIATSATALALPDDIVSEDDPRLVELGREAFARYPVQLAPYLRVGVVSRDAAARYGLWVDETAGVSGLVRARMADGSAEIALTCATCHAAVRGGAVVRGVPNASLDLGAATLAASGEVDPVVAAWGRGRVDVTTTSGTEPVAIPDLRPVRFLTHLHHDATLAMRDRATLAIRIETLVITSYGQTVRPPRIVALALAAYVASLADALPPVDAARTRAARGAEVFATTCARCHAGDGLTGPPVPLAVVGTDPALGRSAERGTGMYRVPSLRGVGSRGPLLHDGRAPSLDAMFDPARLTPGYAGGLHGGGPIVGHPFGLDLAEVDRAALLAYLRAL